MGSSSSGKGFSFRGMGTISGGVITGTTFSGGRSTVNGLSIPDIGIGLPVFGKLSGCGLIHNTKAVGRARQVKVNGCTLTNRRVGSNSLLFKPLRSIGGNSGVCLTSGRRICICRAALGAIISGRSAGCVSSIRKRGLIALVAYTSKVANRDEHIVIRNRLLYGGPTGGGGLGIFGG